MTDPTRTTFTRDDIIDGLRELTHELQTHQRPARIRLIGGAAIALTVNAARPATMDLDGPFEPVETVRTAAAAIALRRHWRADWLNDAAAVFIPSGLGTTPTWRTIHQDDWVTVQVADPETLLAMKLHAVQIRSNRDSDDLANLLPLCRIDTVAAAEALYEQYYPGDGFSIRTDQLVHRILEQQPTPPAPPPLPTLG